MIRRIEYDRRRHNILAITERPTAPPEPLSGFEFCGYDILDSHDSISVLSNCGDFPGIFAGTELNSLGLLGDLALANEVAEAIRSMQSDDDHCLGCRVWGVARYL